MPIAVACSCGKRFQAKDELAGRQVKCPNCGDALTIPKALPQQPQPDLAANPFSDATSQMGNMNREAAASPSPHALTPPTKRATAAKKPNSGLIIGLCIGGGVFGVLLLILITAIFWSFGSGRDNAGSIAAGGNVESTGPNTPAPKLAPVARIPETIGTREVPPGDATPSTTTVSDLTDEECLEAATRFASAIMSQDVAAAQGLVDFNEVLRRVTADIAVSEGVKRGFNTGFLSKTANGGFERQIIEVLSNGGSYSALRVHHVGDETRVWMRLNSDDQGLNYQDLIFFRGADGQPHVSDMYVVVSGELLSQTMRRMFIPLAASTDRNLLQRLTGVESDFVTHFGDLQQMMAQLRTQPALTLAAYNRLPESLRKNKSIMLIRVQAASSVNEQDYSTAIDDFRKAFPNDAAVEMLSIDWYLMREEYDKSLAAIDAVDRVVGGDPHLNALRANVFHEQGDYDRAEASATKAIEADPSLEDAYWALVNTAMARGDFAAVLRQMKLLDSTFAMEWGDLREIPEYAPFVNSPQYEEWLAHLESK